MPEKASGDAAPGSNPAPLTTTAKNNSPAAIHFIFCILSLSLRSICSLNTEGVITHAPPQALVCLARNAFGTPSFGRASNSVLALKLPVSRGGQQPKPQIVFSFYFFYIR